LDDIAPIVIPENPPWLNLKSIFNFELQSTNKSLKKSLLIQQYFAEIRSVTSEYSAICSDSSKNGDRVASAAVLGQQLYSVRLPSVISIFTTEASAILLALELAVSSDESKVIICSDSLSCLSAPERCKTQSPFIFEIVEIDKSLVAIGKHVIFTWIPSHIGIHGTTAVDALDDPIFSCSILYTDLNLLL